MIKTILILTTMLTFSTKNPIKLSFQVMIVALILFCQMWMLTGSSWIPVMLTLLFTGGILIMFMILSTFHPNESPSKTKISKAVMMILATSALLTHTKISRPDSITSSMKMFYQSNATMVSTTLMILLYFTMFLMILKKEENSMRMILCRKSKSDL